MVLMLEETQFLTDLNLWRAGAGCGVRGRGLTCLFVHG